MNCACGEEWRIEACDLRTGRVRSILHPLSFDFQTILNRVGQGTLNLATRGIVVRDIWPHLTSVYITRLSGGDATPEAPRVEFGGIIESFAAGDNGATSVGLKSIDQYLHHRQLGMARTAGLSFYQTPQTEIGRALVQQSYPNGIPLTAVAELSSIRRDRNYPGYERKNIGEAVEELTDVINGVDYEVTHERDGDSWRSVITFRDFVGGDRNVILKSDREAAGYGLVVDAQNHATYVDAMGAGEEEAQLVAHARDNSGIYPRFDSSPAWMDVSIPSTLASHAQGFLNDNREPIATPSATVRGLDDPDPRSVRNGDTVRAEINYGAVTFNGRARVLSSSWSVGSDGPASRVYELVPIDRASESVLNQTPADDNCEDC